MKNKEIEQLNSFLRGELSAVETYRQAIEKIDDLNVKKELVELKESHKRRANMLHMRIMSMGAEPETESGPWGTFAKLVEGGAKVFGVKSALSALEAGEDHGRDDYKRDLEDLTPTTRRWVETEILPQQLATHDKLNKVRERI